MIGSRVLSGGAALFVVAAALPAAAQMNMPMAEINMNRQLFSGVLQNNARAAGRDPRPYAVAPPRGLGRPYPPPPPAEIGVATTYRASPAVTARVQRQFVDYVRKQAGEAGAADMARAFQARDLRRWWAEVSASDGMRLGDVADAMTEYWVTNWLIVQRRTDASPGQYRAVRAQVKATMAGDPAFARLSNDQRQEMAEVFMYNTLLQAQAYQNGVKAGDRSLVGRLGEAAVARFRNEMGVDLRGLALTDQGFVGRG